MSPLSQKEPNYFSQLCDTFLLFMVYLYLLILSDFSPWKTIFLVEKIRFPFFSGIRNKIKINLNSLIPLICFTHS